MQALSDLIDLVSLERCSEIAIATSLFSLQLICHVICDVAWERSIHGISLFFGGTGSLFT